MHSSSNPNDQRLEEILQAIHHIQSKMPNGEIEGMKTMIEAIKADQSVIKGDLDYFKKRLFNPDDGVIVRINKNTESIERFEEEIEEIIDDYPRVLSRLEALESWRDGVNKALWIIYTSIIGLILTAVFGILLK
jgi:archaellum component FlaC